MWARIKKIIIRTLATLGAIVVILIALGFLIQNTEKQEATTEATEPKPQPASPPPPSYRSEIKKYTDYQDKKVGDIREISTKLAREIAIGFAAQNEVPKEFFDSFYRCMGDFANTKSAELPVNKIMGWCLVEYKKNPKEFKDKQSAYSFYDFINQFSRWNGSHPPSVEVIKNEMHDPDSFKHLSTTFRFIRDKENKIEAWITTRFTGTNGFGARVQSTILTRINPNTGQVLEIKEGQ